MRIQIVDFKYKMVLQDIDMDLQDIEVQLL